MKSRRNDDSFMYVKIPTSANKTKVETSRLEVISKETSIKTHMMRKLVILTQQLLSEPAPWGPWRFRMLSKDYYLSLIASLSIRNPISTRVIESYLNSQYVPLHTLQFTIIRLQNISSTLIINLVIQFNYHGSHGYGYLSLIYAV
ncbi:Hypothetical_protein [Hexamita inflata]|uniref:Hypothetical_protein n=1 Tax=Hexamita inflata TaxID=28002 RepID=A0AA86P6H1_9EUKA|nr:Hypothetical protein HINF_LOCUS18925 [Hexamita inflata]CAI9957123.1 Hypothetical protein HINF_LOCUS44768 [Hexamita inflata]